MKVWHETLHRIIKKIEDGIIIDCRNLYETEIGRFRGAIPLPINYHREAFKALQDTLSQISLSYPVYIYCTGGVRCEKLAKFLHVKGFRNVNQLQGGLYAYLKYSRTLQQSGQRQRKMDMTISTKAASDNSNMFKGKVFSFDKRATFQSHTDRCDKSDILSKCHQCNKTPSDSVTNCPVCGILFIQCNGCKSMHHGCCSKECMEEYATSNISLVKNGDHNDNSYDGNISNEQEEKELEISQRRIDELRRKVKDTAGSRLYLPDLISRGVKTVLTKNSR